MMRNFNFLLAAVVGLFLVSCASDDLVVVSPPDQPVIEEEVPILFSSTKMASTRSETTGADAAALLGGEFVVSGKKGATTASTTGNIVFDNYRVKWYENSAGKTESNSSNWEYVSQDRTPHAIAHGITSQTIKYWDYAHEQYDFIAWSAGAKTAVYDPSELADGKVYVGNLDPNATATSAVTFTGKAADLAACYIADLVTVKRADYGKVDAQNPVTFRFRQLGTKVRIAIYETIPGYSVKDVKFYSAAAVALLDETDPTDGAANAIKNAQARIFTTVANNIFTEGTYTVTFPSVDGTTADNNLAHVAFTPKAGQDQTTTVEWGGLNYTIAEEGEKIGTKFLGRTSQTASFAGDPATNYYVIYLPNEAGTNLNLRVNFTLEAIDGSGEEITVKGATAQVPSIYTTWKPGYAYTYIFKISDKTNGYTGVYDPTKPDDTTVNSDPAGLYPITFDAVVVNAEEDGIQETITTVATPSITSYQKGSSVVNNDEYLATTGDIFVTVNDGNTGDTPDLANGKLVTLTGKAALYAIEDGMTEAEVIDALQMQDDDAPAGTIKGRSGKVLTAATQVAALADLDAANEYMLTNSVEFGVDGNAIPVATDQALRFKAAAATTYAFVYTKTAATATTDKFEPVSKAAGAAVNGLYRFALVAAPAGDVQKGVTYFPAGDASAAAITAFLGQTVNNLYLDAAGATIANGYAATGTTYYYTVDHGMTYLAATNIAYADFATADLYLDAACTVAKTETTPNDGVTYYDNTGNYCVILPQQTTGLFVIDDVAAKVACAAADTAVDGMTYFDKYTQNNGVYYTKVIKVQ